MKQSFVSNVTSRPARPRAPAPDRARRPRSPDRLRDAVHGAEASAVARARHRPDHLVPAAPGRPGRALRRRRRAGGSARAASRSTSSRPSAPPLRIAYGAGVVGEPAGAPGPARCSCRRCSPHSPAPARRARPRRRPRARALAALGRRRRADRQALRRPALGHATSSSPARTPRLARAVLREARVVICPSTALAERRRARRARRARHPERHRAALRGGAGGRAAARPLRRPPLAGEGHPRPRRRRGRPAARGRRRRPAARPGAPGGRLSPQPPSCRSGCARGGRRRPVPPRGLRRRSIWRRWRTRGRWSRPPSAALRDLVVEGETGYLVGPATVPVPRRAGTAAGRSRAAPAARRGRPRTRREPLFVAACDRADSPRLMPTRASSRVGAGGMARGHETTGHERGRRQIRRPRTTAG